MAMMSNGGARVSEIAPDVYQVSTYIRGMNLQFNQFLIRDEEPLLFHTGMRSLFPAVREAVAKVIDPSTLRWIGFSHFEADECGALREWQLIAPRADALCSVIAKAVSVDDVVAERPARALNDGEVLATGNHRLRFAQTPHVPHGWDAGLLFEEVHKTLFCSDILYHKGDVEPSVSSDIVDRSRASLAEDQMTPFANPYPYTPATAKIYRSLAALEPRTLAVMHGSSFVGDGKRALEDYSAALVDVFGSDELG